MRHGEAPRGWWSHNWGWVAGCGCLLVVLVPSACVGLGWLAFDRALDRFTPWDEALERLREDPRAAAALGRPIEPFRGSLDTEILVDDGTATLRIPVAGPAGRGVLHVDAEQDAGGEWVYRRLALDIEDSAEPLRIDLLEPAP